MPALVAYAAADAEVFPVDAQITARAPSSAAFEIAIVIPRSLKEPVGFAPSTFNQTSLSNISERMQAATSGVPPSSKVTTGVFLETGRRSRYSSITPRHWCEPDFFPKILMNSCLQRESRWQHLLPSPAPLDQQRFRRERHQWPYVS